MKDKIRLEVMKVFNQEADVDKVVDNILLLFSFVGRSEHLPCEHPYYSIIGEEHGNPKCLKCGKNL